MKITSKRGRKKLDIDLDAGGGWPFPPGIPDPLSPEDEEVLRKTAAGLDWPDDYPDINWIVTGDDDADYPFLAVMYEVPFYLVDGMIRINESRQIIQVYRAGQWIDLITVERYQEWTESLDDDMLQSSNETNS